MIGKIKKATGLPVVLCVAVAAVCALAFPDCVAEGARQGLRMCANVLVPSLFPFLFIGAFAAASPACGRVMRVFSPVAVRLFRLPPEAAPALVLGFVGGYPVGCATAAQLHEQGKINSEQAQRLTFFCVNAGPAFVVSAVGSGLYSSTKAGAVLFAACALSSFVTGLALSFTAPEPETGKAKATESISESQALVSATERTAQSVIRICAWTVLFSCLCAAVQVAVKNEGANSALKCVMEVTSGCISIAGKGKLCTTAAVLGWGGLSVCCQVAEYVKQCGAKFGVFLAFRALNAALSAVLCELIQKLFPIEISVFSNAASVNHVLFYDSVPAAAALICLCAVFVIDLDRSKKIC